MPITFIQTGIGSGSLNGVPFGPSDFTITATGDTGNRAVPVIPGTSTPIPGEFVIPHDTASIDIAGVGTLTFAEPTLTFVSQPMGAVGFSRSPSGWDLFDGPVFNPALAAWDMTSSVGPVFGTGALMQWGPGVATNLGPLTFNDDWTVDPSAWDIPATFQAIVGPVPVPAPAALLLGPLGAALVAHLRRRGTV